MDMKIFTLSLFAVIIVCQGHFFIGDNIRKLNFVASNVVSGRKTIRVAYGGILGLESFVDGVNERGLFIREVTDGKKLVKLIYADKDTLLTCDLLKKDPQELLQFLKHFLSRDSVQVVDMEQQGIISHLEKQGNFSWDSMKSNSEYSSLTDIDRLSSECREFYKVKTQTMKALRAGSHKADVAGKNRQKRENRFIYPGTKWCGKGSLSKDYEDLGDRRSTDKCCRTHDMCPYYIESMTRDYGYYNYGISTMVHCECDERFRTCLKFQNNPVADNLGEIFFNRLATKCFILKPERVCAKRSFWGRCKEYKEEYRATVLEPMEY